MQLPDDIREAKIELSMCRSLARIMKSRPTAKRSTVEVVDPVLALVLRGFRRGGQCISAKVCRTSDTVITEVSTSSVKRSMARYQIRSIPFKNMVHNFVEAEVGISPELRYSNDDVVEYGSNSQTSSSSSDAASEVTSQHMDNSDLNVHQLSTNYLPTSPPIYDKQSDEESLNPLEYISPPVVTAVHDEDSPGERDTQPTIVSRSTPERRIPDIYSPLAANHPSNPSIVSQVHQNILYAS